MRGPRPGSRPIAPSSKAAPVQRTEDEILDQIRGAVSAAIFTALSADRCLAKWIAGVLRFVARQDNLAVPEAAFFCVWAKPPHHRFRDHHAGRAEGPNAKRHAAVPAQARAGTAANFGRVVLMRPQASGSA